MNSGSTHVLRPVAVKGLNVKNKLLKTVMLATATTLLSFNWGCSGEEYNGLPGPDPTRNEVPVTVMMNIPAAASTRALTSAQEDAVNTLDVIVFLDPKDGTDETYLYTTHGSEYLAEGNVTAVKVNFQKSKQGEAHRFVMVANMSAEIYTIKDSWTVGMTKKDLLSTLTFDAYDLAETDQNKRVWDTTTPRYLPMWGESAGSHVVTSSLQGYSIGTIKMLRAVATVDIVLNPDAGYQAQGFGNLFHLHDIKVYNVPQKGFGGPDPDNLETAVKVDKPTVSAAFHRDASTVIAYEADQTLDEHLYGTSKTIYIPEADNTASGVNLDDSKQTCLVISGRYNGETDLTWYRMDFIKVLEQQKNLRWDILRNHRYVFYITSVDGPGYPDEETAFNSAPLNLDSDIIVWNDEGKMNDITFDGNYHLSVDTDSLYFYNEGRARAVNITTDHPDGWQVVIPSPDMDWVTTLWPNINGDGNAYGAKNSTDEVEFECDKITNPLEVDREGYIMIKAGKLRKYIKIYQGNVEELTIEVSPTQINFMKSGSKPKTVTVKVYPETSTIYFLEVPGDKPIVWLPAYDPNQYATGISGIASFALQPGVNTSNPEAILSSLITVYVKDSEGKMGPAQTITVQQFAADMVFRSTTYNNYSAGAGNYSFAVDSQTDWHISSVDDTQSMVTSAETNISYPAGDNFVYQFGLNANNTWATRSATFRVGSNNPDFSGDDIQVIQNYIAPTIQSLSPTALNFTGATPGAQNVTVTSNSQWQFATSGQFAQAATSNPGAGVVSGTSTPHQQTPHTVTFTPVAYNATLNSTPAANTLYTGYADFYTANHSPAPAPAAKRVTITRTVPSYFTIGTATASNLTAAGGTLTVNATTNNAWNISVTGTNSMTTLNNNMGSNIYAARSLSVTIPSNPNWTSRTIYVNYAGTHTSGAVSGRHTTTFSQPAQYTITGASLSVSSILGGGQNVTVTVNGTYPGSWVQVRAYGTNVSVSGTITSGKSVVLKIPNNPSKTGRSVQFQYRRYINGAWEAWGTNIGSAITQAGGYIQLGTGALVAWTDATNNNNFNNTVWMNWSTAAGLPDSYNYSSISDATNLKITPTTQTGCGGYSDSSYGILKWRMPTLVEVNQMLNYVDELSLDKLSNSSHNSKGYWSTYHWSATQSQVYIISESRWYSLPKTNSARVRCVIDP